jgi:O-acetyl-ADP-ribose deacetylase (regulator of RNase III)
LLEFLIPPISVAILEGDITARHVDAIVNAANNAFWMGGGVAGAIKRRGGVQIEVDAMAQGPVEPGESVLTRGGTLPARHVIHAAVMGQDLRTDARLIGLATASALRLAANHGVRSIAFPALGTGVGGFSIAECARVMLGVIRDLAATGTTLQRAEFVLFGREAYDQFSNEAERLLKLRPKQREQ